MCFIHVPGVSFLFVLEITAIQSICFLIKPLRISGCSPVAAKRRIELPVAADEQEAVDADMLDLLIPAL